MYPQSSVSGFWWPLKMTTLAAPKSSPPVSLGTTSRRRAGSAGEQTERDQAVRLAAAHRLGEIERSVVALAGEPFEAALDQQLSDRR